MGKLIEFTLENNLSIKEENEAYLLEVFIAKGSKYHHDFNEDGSVMLVFDHFAKGSKIISNIKKPGATPPNQ